MAKKKKKKKAAEEAPKLNKKEIKAFYAEHGWRETVSHFGIAPKDLSPIVGKTDGPKKPPKKKKGKKAKAESADKAQTPKKGKKKAKKANKGAEGKSPEAPYGYKKDGTPRKPPGRKAGKKVGKKTAKKDAEISAPAPKKRRGRPPAAKSADKKHGRPPGRPTADEEVLDWLLAYRAKNQKAGHMLPLDSVIIDLTAKIRK